MLQPRRTGALVSPGRGWAGRTAANSLSVAVALSVRPAACVLGRGSASAAGRCAGAGFLRSVSAFALVDVLLKAVGDTPIMKNKKWAVERTRTIQGLIDFIKKFLKLVASEQLVRALPCLVSEPGKDAVGTGAAWCPVGLPGNKRVLKRGACGAGKAAGRDGIMLPAS